MKQSKSAASAIIREFVRHARLDQTGADSETVIATAELQRRLTDALLQRWLKYRGALPCRDQKSNAAGPQLLITSELERPKVDDNVLSSIANDTLPVNYLLPSLPTRDSTSSFVECPLCGEGCASACVGLEAWRSVAPHSSLRG